MLRTKIKCRWLINHTRIVPRMPRRKTKMLPARRIHPTCRRIQTNVQKLVQWITVRQPRRTLLIRTEQITSRIECKGNRKSYARTNRLSTTEIRRHPLHRSTHTVDVIRRFTALINQPGVGEIRGPQSKIQTAVGPHRQTRGIDILSNLLPARRHHNLFVRSVVTISVSQQHHLALRCDKYTGSMSILWRSRQQTYRPPQTARIAVEHLSLILQPVAVCVPQQMHIAVVSQRHQHTVVPITHVVDIGQHHRQLRQFKSRSQQLHGWRILGQYQRFPNRQQLRHGGRQRCRQIRMPRLQPRSHRQLLLN